MSTDLTTQEEIEESWDELIDYVDSRETYMEEEVLTGDKIGVASFLTEVTEKWDEGEKSLRALPVLNTFEEYSGRKASEELRDTLLGFDAYINNLDDTIDTQNPGKKEKIGYTACTAFSGSFAFLNTPEELREDVQEATFKYLSDVFQVPSEEATTMQTMEESSDTGTIIDAAQDGYSYRARDIDGFTDIAASYFGVEGSAKQQIKEDLRSYRAKELLIKDIGDVPEDLEDEDITPVIEILDRFDVPEAEEMVNELYSSFEYSTASEGNYKSELVEKEPNTENLTPRLEEAESYLS